MGAFFEFPLFLFYQSDEHLGLSSHRDWRLLEGKEWSGLYLVPSMHLYVHQSTGRPVQYLWTLSEPDSSRIASDLCLWSHCPAPELVQRTSGHI